MSKLPVDSYSNENFIPPFFRTPGAANLQKGRRHIRNQSTPARKIWRELTLNNTVTLKSGLEVTKVIEPGAGSVRILLA